MWNNIVYRKCDVSVDFGSSYPSTHTHTHTSTYGGDKYANLLESSDFFTMYVYHPTSCGTP